MWLYILDRQIEIFVVVIELWWNFLSKDMSFRNLSYNSSFLNKSWDSRKIMIDLGPICSPKKNSFPSAFNYRLRLHVYDEINTQTEPFKQDFSSLHRGDVNRLRLFRLCLNCCAIASFVFCYDFPTSEFAKSGQSACFFSCLSWALFFLLLVSCLNGAFNEVLPNSHSTQFDSLPWRLFFFVCLFAVLITIEVGFL